MQNDDPGGVSFEIAFPERAPRHGYGSQEARSSKGSACPIPDPHASLSSAGNSYIGSFNPGMGVQRFSSSSGVPVVQQEPALGEVRVLGMTLRVFLGVFVWTLFILIAMLLHSDRAWPLALITVLFLLQYSGVLAAFYVVPFDWLANVFSDERQRYLGQIMMLLVVMGIGGSLVYEVVRDFRKIQPLFGFVVILGSCAAASTSSRHIRWPLIFRGLVIQFLLAAFLMRTQTGYELFRILGDSMSVFLENSDMGAAFVFGDAPFVLTSLAPHNSTILPEPVPPFKVHFFAFKVMPTTIFFSAFVSCLYFLGVLQSMVSVLSKMLRFVMGTSPLESVSAVGNIFLGMTETPLLVKPFLPTATESEIHAVMTSGFATIAGSVMAVYISMGISPPQLLAASVMAAPAALTVSKLFCPETEAQETDGSGGPIDFQMPEPTEKNIIEAAGNGASTAIGLVANVVAMLIAFLALISVLNRTLGYLGGLVDLPSLSFEWACGYLFAPVAWLLGTPPADMFMVGELLGLKIFVNEFVAYDKLARLKNEEKLSDQAIVVATFSLCGFANLGSMGIALGGLTSLAPARQQTYAKLVFSAMLAGCVTSFLNACLASILHQTPEIP